MLAAWLETLLVKSATDVELAGKTIFQFTNRIRKTLLVKPVQEWEAALWARGLKTGLLRQTGYFFRAGAGKASCLSFFIRNDQGRYVGLRRESITQAATYVSLVTEHGYARSQARFESQWMDVVIYDENGRVFMYAENKASAKILSKLCSRLESEFKGGLPPDLEDDKPIDDAIMKARHIWRHRPQLFWAVSPTLRQCYQVDYSVSGFSLTPHVLDPTLVSSGSCR